MAVLFDEASTEYLDWTTTAPITSEPGTMAVWFRNDSSTLNDRCMIQIQDRSLTDEYFRMSIGDEGAVTPSTINEILVGANSSGGSFSKASTSTSGSVGVGEWHHALATFVTTTSRLIYLDGGNSAEDTTLHSSLVFDSITIGYEQDASPGDPWDGGLMWPAVWDRALDAAEIAMAAAGVHPTMIAPDALVFFAPLDNAQGYRDWISGAAPTVNGTPVYVDGPHVMSSGGIMVPAQTGGITITDVNTTESWNDGDTGLVITGTGFV